jgi:hypothetical protein
MFVNNSYCTREDCERWLQDNYPGIRVPRSDCLGCPFHTDAEWREIKSRPEEWETVLTLDRHLRTIASKKAAPYLHRSRKPLDELSFSRRGEDDGQLNWLNECEGLCGV